MFIMNIQAFEDYLFSVFSVFASVNVDISSVC